MNWGAWRSRNRRALSVRKVERFIVLVEVLPGRNDLVTGRRKSKSAGFPHDNSLPNVVVSGHTFGRTNHRQLAAAVNLLLDDPVLGGLHQPGPVQVADRPHVQTIVPESTIISGVDFVASTLAKSRHEQRSDL